MTPLTDRPRACGRSRSSSSVVPARPVVDELYEREAAAVTSSTTRLAATPWPVRFPEVSFGDHGHSQENIGGKSIMGRAPRPVAGRARGRGSSPPDRRGRHRHLSLAGADISRRHPRRECQLVPEPRHLRSARAEARATPVVAAKGNDRDQQRDGRETPSSIHRLAPRYGSRDWSPSRAQSHRRTEAL